MAGIKNFEPGDLTEWDVTYTNGGDVSAHADAALHGSYGMKVVIDDTGTKGVQDTDPTAQTRWRGRVYLDPNGVAMAENDEFYIIALWYSDWNEAGGVKLKYSSGYTVYHYAQTDAGWSWGSAYAITDAVHFFEFDYYANAGGGFHKLWIDNVFKEEKTGLDNDTRTIDSALIGTLWTAAGTSGIVYYDDFKDNYDGSAIGPVGETYELSVTDGLSMGDSITQNAVLQISLADGLSMGDVGTLFLAMGVSVEDIVKLGDSPSVSGEPIELSITDGVKLSDLAQVIKVAKTCRHIRSAKILIRSKT